MEAYSHKTSEEENEVFFYNAGKPNGYMSNFARIPLLYDGVMWPTSEHLYQAYKFQSQEMRDKVRQVNTKSSSSFYIEISEIKYSRNPEV